MILNDVIDLIREEAKDKNPNGEGTHTNKEIIYYINTALQIICNKTKKNFYKFNQLFSSSPIEISRNINVGGRKIRLFDIKKILYDKNPIIKYERLFSILRDKEQEIENGTGEPKYYDVDFQWDNKILLYIFPEPDKNYEIEIHSVAYPYYEEDNSSLTETFDFDGLIKSAVVNFSLYKMALAEENYNLATAYKKDFVDFLTESVSETKTFGESSAINADIIDVMQYNLNSYVENY